MDKALRDLIKISNTTGKDSTLVQGGGGNTSVKTADGKYMYIKASGTALKDMNDRSGWRRVRLEPVLSLIDDESLAKLESNKREAEVVNRLMLACEDTENADARPSVEANLHAFLDKYVIHLHPNAVNAYANAKNGQAELEKLFKDTEPGPLWVPYTDPGLTLAKSIARRIEKYRREYGTKPRVLFLQKHGLFVSAQSAALALKLVKQVISRCTENLKYPRSVKTKKPGRDKVAEAKLLVRRALSQATGEYNCLHHFYDDEIAAFLADKEAAKMLKAASLAPDEMVYANGPPIWVSKNSTDKQLARRIGAASKCPKSFAVEGIGLIVAADETQTETLVDIAKSSFFVRANAHRMGGILSLNNRQQEFINQWESEAFRKKMSEGGGEKVIAGQIAVVTGAGSGIGKSLAIGLARAGAYVGLADIDAKAIKQTAEEIENELGPGRSHPFKCNVCDEKSVVECFDNVVDRWGGLDILVNAAGIAPAFGLVDMPVNKWRAALEVNLTGYFLMAKTAAKIMKRQQMGGSIVNISSKSGLQASKNNSAYNATKAGELHIARGWAMELGPDGIRVNSVCPGNVFEGSKIWNPDYIKVCAKKYGIKPEEVIPYYINKTSLKREIKGQDIADAVVFLCSDKARTITGQTIVADSGQVMVR